MTMSELDPGLPHRCPVCGDVVGLYEPAIVEARDGETHRTSLLAHGEDAVERAYHLPCRPSLDT
jgi:hypothetical protein